jgi:hypothetical protein
VVFIGFGAGNVEDWVNKSPCILILLLRVTCTYLKKMSKSNFLCKTYRRSIHTCMEHRLEICIGRSSS